ncbi:MAG TPA: Gfo/Idh/MocA family oxidoreductase, partial [Chloroflexota bacterium]|nr:Gfo/Idh/MocA family oxidoreductase [Chloroflexota bacterium]
MATGTARKIRVGIVGATVTQGGSGWGAHAHVPALAALPEYELKAVCTAHAETAEASRVAFGAELAFHEFDAMVARPDIDLVAVVVRVPGHHALVVKALEAGKNVFCEWPLGRTLEEAEEMAHLAAQRSLRTAVGLQARSDAVWLHARELIREGYVGEVKAVNARYVSRVVAERGNGRIWQSDRRNGANTLTIAAGHAIDALCFLVGELEEVSGRLATKVTEWRNTDTDEAVRVDSPDWISLSGRAVGGAEVSFLCATVPHSPSGNVLEIYGDRGTLVVSGGSPNVGPSELRGARSGESLAALATPDRFRLAPESVPAGPARNVAQAYARLAAAMRSDTRYEP